MTRAQILARLPSLKALVVGDICLDRWCTYDPALAEASRETGLPRVAVVATETTAGAAGTVANNLADLGTGQVAVMGVLGDDGFGYELGQALARRRISTEHVVRSAEVPTFTYTKLLNAVTGEEDLPRVDFIPNRPAPAAVEREIADRLRDIAPGFDIVFISDQAETQTGGAVTPLVRETLAELAAAHPSIVFLADSRVRAPEFRHIMLKPNEDEAAAAIARVEGGYFGLRQHTRAPLLFVTHGGRGVTWVDDEQEHFEPTERIANPVDICGAGDAFGAGLSLALAAGATAPAAIAFGHAVASITVMKKGTGTATPAELL